MNLLLNKELAGIINSICKNYYPEKVVKKGGALKICSYILDGNKWLKINF